MRVGVPLELWGIVLAAGASRRFGTANKLVAEVDGEPLVRRVVRRLLATDVARVMVVTGHERELVERALDGLDVVLVHNPRHLEGMGTTVAAAVMAVPDAAAGVLITPGDLPDASTRLMQTLIDLWRSTGGSRVAYPVLPDGSQRNPVLWPRAYFARLAALEGDRGARDLLRDVGAAALPVPQPSEAEFVDIDRPEDLDRWRSGSSKR